MQSKASSKSKTPKTVSRQARRRQARSMKKKGVSFGVSDLAVGPVRVGDAYFKYGRSPLTDTVGAASRSLNIQVRQPWMRTESHPKFGSVDVLGGTDRIGPVTTDTLGNFSGDILFTQNINPGEFVTSRMGQFNPLYQRYRIRKMTMLYEGATGTDALGQLIGYYDSDVDNPLVTDSPNNAQVAAAQVGNEIAKLWEDQAFQMGEMDPYTTLFTQAASSSGGDERLHLQSIFYLLAGTELAPNLDLGVMYVEYEIEFYIPALAITSAISPQPYSACWGNTSLDVSFDATHPLGGAPVPQSFMAANYPSALQNMGMSVAVVTGGTTVSLSDIPLGKYLVNINFPLGATWSVTGTAGLFVTAVSGIATVSATNGTIGTTTTSPGGVAWYPFSQVVIDTNLTAVQFKVSIGPGTFVIGDSPPTQVFLSVISYSNLIPISLSRPSRYLARGKDWESKRERAKIEEAYRRRDVKGLSNDEEPEHKTKKAGLGGLLEQTDRMFVSKEKGTPDSELANPSDELSSVLRYLEGLKAEIRTLAFPRSSDS